MIGIRDGMNKLELVKKGQVILGQITKMLGPIKEDLIYKITQYFILF